MRSDTFWDINQGIHSVIYTVVMYGSITAYIAPGIYLVVLFLYNLAEFCILEVLLAPLLESASRHPFDPHYFLLLLLTHFFYLRISIDQIIISQRERRSAFASSQSFLFMHFGLFYTV